MKQITNYYRNGESHRDGADVSFTDIVKYFGFKSAKVGNWVTKKEQQNAANLFFDAFCDLADILQVPKDVISLRGTLSIAYGSGGNRYTKAHYSPSSRTLSLAKKAGGGALAHEWWHAFDHYISPKMFKLESLTHFATSVWLNNTAKMIEHPLNQSLADTFSSILLENDNPSRLVATSVAFDKQQNIYYYAKPEELSARAFEACIQHHTIKNHFLAAGTIQSQEAKQGLYPSKAECNIIWYQLSRYFQTLARELLV
ncbi:MAG: CLCA_X family protein [Pseudomonadota bacterium]